jgi:hypothetical protein
MKMNENSFACIQIHRLGTDIAKGVSKATRSYARFHTIYKEKQELLQACSCCYNIKLN